MTEYRRFIRLLHCIWVTLFLVSCNASNDQKGTELSPQDWPSDLTAPIEGATFSLSENHLPGASRDHPADTHRGFEFFNGHSGRPLAGDEPVVAIADGEIIRIDQGYEPPAQARQAYYSQMAKNPGFIGDFALDQLRGRQVWIRHEQDHVSRYAHLSEVHPELQPGDGVEKGQVIGLMGNTGIPATEDQPDPVPRLHFELWSADGSHHFGQDLTPLETHQAIAAAFSEKALPRYARRIVAQVEAGEAAPEHYPPDPLPETGFNVDLPDTLRVGSAFAAPITWEGEDFETSDFFATLQGNPLGIIQAPDGAWILGAMPLDTAGKQLTLLVGATDPYGETLIGNRAIAATGRGTERQALEIDAASLERYSQENIKIESERLGQMAFQALQQTEPYWDGAFQAPLEGDVIRAFGQKAFHGMLRPAHPLPGVAIAPTAGATVQASNHGLVGFVGELPIRGKTIALIHGGGIVSIYGHLDEIAVAVGDEISRGTALGRVGQSGATSRAQLRWEIQVAGIPTDPIGWLDRTLPRH